MRQSRMPNAEFDENTVEKRVIILPLLHDPMKKMVIVLPPVINAHFNRSRKKLPKSIIILFKQPLTLEGMYCVPDGEKGYFRYFS